MAMRDHPIVVEVRAARGRLAAECGHDVNEILRRIRKRQAECGLVYVQYPPRRMTVAEDAETASAMHDGWRMALEMTAMGQVDWRRLDRDVRSGEQF